LKAFVIVGAFCHITFGALATSGGAPAVDMIRHCTSDA